MPTRRCACSSCAGTRSITSKMAAEASRKPLLAEVETLKQRLRKTDAEITETKRQIGRDESLLTGKKDLADLTERGATLGTRIEELHRQIREIQGSGDLQS